MKQEVVVVADVIDADLERGVVHELVARLQVDHGEGVELW